MYRILLLLCLIALPAHARSQADILRAQQELGKLGYDLTADGHESPAIAAAIRAYQRDWQLPEDGLLSADIHARLIRADPATAPAMQKAEGRECRVRNDAPGARETVTHDGPCLAGVREGEGRTTWRFMQNGQWREEAESGTFRNGTLNGRGERHYADGNVYVGDFVDGARTGRDEYYFDNGDVYIGDYVAGARTGQGEFRYASGNAYIGDFVEDALTGKGEYRYADGSVYIGDFVDGAETGKGEYRYADGSVYIGDFVQDAETGKGEYRYSNGDVYVGDYVNDRPHGWGTYRRAGGETFQGIWNEGCLDTGAGMAAVGRTSESCGF